MFDASIATLLLILDTHPSVGFHCSYDRSHPFQHTHTHSLENAIDCGSFIDDLSDVEASNMHQTLRSEVQKNNSNGTRHSALQCILKQVTWMEYVTHRRIVYDDGLAEISVQ